MSCLLYRNIPTGVGRRKDSSSRRSNLSEHPHGRGEKMQDRRGRVEDCGTSPRAWGEASARSRAAPTPRNIPTGVGRRQNERTSSRLLEEHPHGRGEKSAAAGSSWGWRGTSPRAWGEVGAFLIGESFDRNIPTGVGRRLAGGIVCTNMTEHPHGRGEKEPLAPRCLSLIGTSPRAWGEGVRGCHSCNHLRNIPTGVGRRCAGAGSRGRWPEHPHGRGEKLEETDESLLKYGTSPRAWGEALAVHGVGGHARNIPTGVGRSCH